MDANSAMSKDGSRFQKPTAFLALMAGAAKRLNQNASWREKIAGHLPSSTQPKSASRFRPRARQSCAKATAPAKGAAILLVKFTTSHSRPLKPTERKEPSRLSEKHSDLSFTAKAE